MCFFWITALIDIFMKIIITREYIMKRKVLAMLVPALLVAGAANAAEIYNKDGNKVDFYGKMVGQILMIITAKTKIPPMLVSVLKVKPKSPAN